MANNNGPQIRQFLKKLRKIETRNFIFKNKGSANWKNADTQKIFCDKFDEKNGLENFCCKKGKFHVWEVRFILLFFTHPKNVWFLFLEGV